MHTSFMIVHTHSKNASSMQDSYMSILMLEIRINMSILIHVHSQCRTHNAGLIHVPTFTRIARMHHQCRTHSCPRTCAIQTSSMQDSFVSKNMRNSNIINAGLIRVQEHVHLYTFTMHNSFMILHKYDMDASWSPTGYHIIERPYTCITHGLHSHSHAQMRFMKDEIVVSFTQPVLKTFSFIEIMGLLTF
jgi:hypothetical protein